MIVAFSIELWQWRILIQVVQTIKMHLVNHVIALYAMLSFWCLEELMTFQISLIFEKKVSFS